MKRLHNAKETDQTSSTTSSWNSERNHCNLSAPEIEVRSREFSDTRIMGFSVSASRQRWLKDFADFNRIWRVLAAANMRSMVLPSLIPLHLLQPIVCMALPSRSARAAALPSMISMACASELAAKTFSGLSVAKNSNVRALQSRRITSLL